MSWRWRIRRGRNDSEGPWDPPVSPNTKGGTTSSSGSPSSRGATRQVGMMGLSYIGWSSGWTASQAPPSFARLCRRCRAAGSVLQCALPERRVGARDVWIGRGTAGARGPSIRPGGYGGFADFESPVRITGTAYPHVNERRGPRWTRRGSRNGFAGNTPAPGYWRSNRLQTPSPMPKVQSAVGWRSPAGLTSRLSPSPINYVR